MGKITLGNKKGAKVKEAEGRYVGDMPPANRAYRVKAGKTWLYQTTRNGDDMIRIPLVINEPKGSKKARYNGYTIWHNLVMTETSAPFINLFLKAAGINPAKFWGMDAKTEAGNNGAQKITAIRGLGKLDSIELIVMASTNTNPKDSSTSLQASSYAPIDSGATTDEDDEDTDKDADDYDDEDSDGEDDDDDADDEDESDDDEDDDDDDF